MATERAPEGDSEQQDAERDVQTVETGQAVERAPERARTDAEPLHGNELVVLVHLSGEEDDAERERHPEQAEEPVPVPVFERLVPVMERHAASKQQRRVETTSEPSSGGRWAGGHDPARMKA